MKKYYLSIILLLVNIAAYCQIYSYTSATDGSYSSVAINATGTALSRVNGATAPGTPCGTGFSTTNFGSTTTYTSSLQAISVTVKPNAGYQLNITSFSVGLRRSGTGPASVRMAYSLDNGVTWTDKGSNDAPGTGGCGSTTTSTWTPSGGITVTSATDGIIFRLFGFNATGTGGTLQILNEVINGTVSSATSLPVVTSDPLAITIPELSNTSFTTNFTGATAFQWQRNTSGISGGVWENITSIYLDSTTSGSYLGYSGSATTTSTLSLINVPYAWNGYGYRCIVSNASGSDTSLPALLSVTPFCTGTPDAGTIVASSTFICGSGSISLTASGASSSGTYLYQWQSSSNGTIWTNIVGATSESYTTPTITDTMHYRRIILCATTSLSDTSGIIIPVLPIPAAISGPLQVCSGLEYVYSCSTPGGVWSLSSTSTATISTYGTFTASAAGSSIISYSISGCSVSLPVVVNESPSAILGSSNICNGVTQLYINASSSGAWSTSNPSIITVTASGYVTALSIGTSVLSYSIPTTGCYASLSITVNELPSAISGSDVACSGAGNVYSSVTVGGSWSCTPSSIASINSVGILNVIAQGIVTVTYTTPAGCFSIKEVETQLFPSTISGVSPVCPPAHLMLSNSVTGGSWTTNNPSRASINSITGELTAVAAGSVTISYTNTCGSAIAPLMINNIPGSIIGQTNVCDGRVYPYSVLASGGTWSSSTPSVASISASGLLHAMLPGTTTLTYSTGIGCNVSFPLIVHHSVATLVDIIQLPDTVVCEGNSVTLYADAINGGASPIYNWSKSGVYMGSGDTLRFVATPGDIVTCIMHSNISCPLEDSVFDIKNIDVFPIVRPEILITPYPNDSVNYLGGLITFFSDITYGGDLPTFQWYVNGTLVPGATNSSYSVNVYSDMDIYCVVTSNLPCIGISKDTSNHATIHGGYLDVNSIKVKNTFAVYPNPASDYTTISVNQLSTGDRYMLIDLNGRILATDFITEQQKIIHTDSIPTGNYILKIIASQTPYITKFSIIH